jgi:HlyD family secretion protein
MKKLIVIAIAAVAAVPVIWYVVGRDGEGDASRYETVEIERGDLENVISSTGQLSAVGTVEVGTQVSGTISRVLVDYNESVRKGQVLAVLDTTMLSASVRQASADVMRSQAQYDQMARDYDREKDLREGNLISEQELQDAETLLETAHASVISANASLDRARANLRYAVIRSPIDGTVIMRNVEPGQTVAASFSTPTLFVIAEDLAEMEIRAQVDESDIGVIEVGQKVRFTVEAHMDETFEGIVRQIWLQPQTVQNVVTYTVVVDAENDRGLLYPGMTAVTDFVVDERHDVLLVSNAAFRFQPSDEMMEEFRSRMQKRMEDLPDSTKAKMGKRGTDAKAPGGQGGGHGGQGGSGGYTGGPPGMSGAHGGQQWGGQRLWILKEDGSFDAVRIEAGATDGRKTEIVRGRGIEEGAKVITKVDEEAERGSTASRALRRGI